MLKSILVGTSLLVASLMLGSCGEKAEKTQDSAAFITIQGQDLIKPDGTKLFIMGTNLGNWLNPEGYMFKFSKTNSPRFINEMFCQLVGPDFTAEFWKAFKDNYITREDIQFIKNTGANIDDSYGYPWLFESETSQQLYCDIWRQIADRYKNEPVILGYELFNEPIAPYFPNMEELNGKLEDIYKKGVAAIREVDNNHIILLGGAQWNGNFKPFKDSKFDDKIMYTCHRYGGDPTKDAIQAIINFRDSVNLPMYMGEIGHNTDEWQAAFCQTMRENNIGYTFWPYKKMDGSSFVGITPPENWANILYFSESPRTSYKEIRDARPDQMMVRKAMMDFIEACKLKNCVVQEGYIQSLGMK